MVVLFCRMPDAMENPRYKWQVVGLLFCIAALNYADRTAISAVFPLVRAELHLSDMELAAIGSLFLWSYAIASPFAGWLADRVSRSRMIVWSLAAWSVVIIYSGFVTSSRELLITRVLLGLAECGYVPAALALVASYHTTGTRGTAISIHNAGLSIGLILGASLSGYLGDHFGWRIGFHVLGGAGLLLSLIAYFFLRDPPAIAPLVKPAATPVFRGIADLFRIPTFLVILTEGTILAVGVWMFLNWLPLYFRETYGMSLAAAGFSATFWPKLTGTLGSTGGGYLSDRFAAGHPQRRMLLQCIWYFASTPFLLAFFIAPGYPVLIACISIFYLMRALGSTNETPILCDVIPPHQRSTAIGIFNTTQTLAGGIGIMVAGALKQSVGLSGVFGGISVLMLAAAFTTLVGYRYFIRKDLDRYRKLNG
ncbi:MAG: MFS transporter [Bryobacteraceae bacterium]